MGVRHGHFSPEVKDGPMTLSEVRPEDGDESTTGPGGSSVSQKSLFSLA